jgi:phage portal protein BeeE
MDEFYKSTMYPIIVNVQEKLKGHLLQGYPSLCIEFDTKNFLKGAPLDQMNFATAGVKNGIMTPNEAREYMNMPAKDGADELIKIDQPDEPIPGSSAQDTGGGGGSQKSKINIGSKT